jgi:hypothetical protein
MIINLRPAGTKRPAVNRTTWMSEAKNSLILEKLTGLRTELVDLAFTLERKGLLEAADVAITTSARVGELCEELTAAS